MASREEWKVSVVSGEVLRRIVAATLPRSEVEHCVAFVREHASANTIGEDELERLITVFVEGTATG